MTALTSDRRLCGRADPDWKWIQECWVLLEPTVAASLVFLALKGRSGSKKAVNEMGIAELGPCLISHVTS